MNHSGKATFLETGGANRGAGGGRDYDGANPDLQMVIDHWDDLPEDVRSSILLIVRAVGRR